MWNETNLYRKRKIYVFGWYVRSKHHLYQMDGGKYATAMFFLISIPIAVGMILSAIPMFKFAMSDKEHDEMLDALVEKRNSAKATETEAE